MTQQLEAMKLALEALEQTYTGNYKRKAFEAITALRVAIASYSQAIEQAQKQEPVAHTYASTQATNCAECGKHKHTPLRIDAMGGYVCLTCIDNKLGSLLGEFGYPEPDTTPQRHPAQEPLQGAVNLKGVVTHVELGQEDDFCKEFGATRIYAAPLQRQPLTDEIAVLRAVSDEYNAWIRYHAGGGDYDSFLKTKGAA